MRRRRSDCGCFGRKRARQIQWLDLGRNALLALLAVVGLRSAALSVDRFTPEELTLLLLGAAMCGALALVWLAHARPRRAVAETGILLASARKAPAHASERPRRSPARRPSADARRKYKAVAGLERKASAATVELDRQKPAALERRQRRTKNAVERRWRAAERDLLELDRRLTRELQALYKAAARAAKESPEGNAALVRAALLHWAVLVRRRAMESFHTRVEGLGRDPDCAGDVIADGLLLRYFDALFREPAELKREMRDGHYTTQLEVVDALVALARQSACLGAQQSATLASHLYWSFVELEGFLRLNGAEHIVPYVAQAASSPLLLFYDVEKYRGSDSPLARWFSQHYGMLAEGVTTRRLPACWHGLWLYDWRSGHLVGYRITDAPRDEDDVEGRAFFRSIVYRENLGNYDCTFSEMIERGQGRTGYVCAGSTCADGEPEQAELPLGQVFSSLAFGLVKGFGVQSGRRGRQPPRVTKSTVCGEGADGRERGEAPAGCADGLEAAGRTREGDAARCLSQQVTTPVERMMACMGEQTGRCADPVGSLTKDLRETTYVGVKLGQGCTLSETADDGADTGADAGAEEADDEAQEAKDELDDAIEEVEKKDEDYEKARDEYIDAANAEHEAEETLDNTPAGENEDEFKAWEAALDRKVEAEQKMEDAYKARDDALEKANKAYENYRRHNNGRCPPDTPDCGGNGCSAMSEAARRTMQCFQRAMDVMSDEVRAPWGEQPVVDPGPDAPIDVDIPCFDALLEPDAAPEGRLGQQCWNVDCGPDLATVAGPGGACECRQQDAVPGDGGLQGNCADVYCAEGAAVFRNGLCECSDDPGTGVFAGVVDGSGLPRPVGSFAMGQPQRFSDVQEEQFGPGWPHG